jgi:hypothetical protein
MKEIRNKQKQEGNVKHSKGAARRLDSRQSKRLGNEMKHLEQT